jgi:hypothetical protein
MLTVTRNNDFGQRFYACADEIFYCHEDIAKECEAKEKKVHPDVLQEFLDIKHDLDDSVQGLLKLVDEIELDSGSSKLKQQITTHTFSIAKYIKELLSFVEDEKFLIFKFVFIPLTTSKSTNLVLLGYAI